VAGNAMKLAADDVQTLNIDHRTSNIGILASEEAPNQVLAR
jgi:hypothetical protein